MDTDLDPDDAIGRRFGALRTWEPPDPADAAWNRVETRRRRRRARRYTVAAVVTLIAVVGSLGAVASLGSSDRRVQVATPPDVRTPADPPIVSVRPPAPVGDIDVQPAGPYRAGQAVRAFVGSSARFRLDDPGNETLELCFEYGGGEICDFAFQSQHIDVQAAPGVAAYDMILPGWVHTPVGLQSCSKVACRLEIADGYGARIGTEPLAMDSGPKVAEPVRVNSVHRDEALLSVHIEGLAPDPSWTRWSATATREEIDGFPAGGLALCAFAETLLCDALVQPDPPPFDGAPHDLTIATNRLLLTREGWVDCAEHVCAVVVSRYTDVTTVNGGVGSDYETLAIVPYTLPATTPQMERPSLTMSRLDEPAGPFSPGEIVSVTLHDPPANTDLERLQLGQCHSEDLQVLMDCRFEFRDWTRLADGSLHQSWEIAPLCTAPGCYLAVTPPAKGYPEVARTTGRFSVAP